jgi:hypothetical protein
MLTQEFVNKLFEYSDGNLYWKNKTNMKTIIGSLAGTKHSKGYWHVCIYKKNYLAHRIIFLLNHGYLPEFIDHIDGNKLNNKIENLREASKAENLWNQKIHTNNKSGIKGVHWDKQRRKWKVIIHANKLSHYVGCFDDLDEAKRQATQRRLLVHQNFARN